MGYYQKQIDQVLNGAKPFGDVYRIKITSDTEHTNFMSITPAELKKIRSILNRK